MVYVSSAALELTGQVLLYVLFGALWLAYGGWRLRRWYRHSQANRRRLGLPHK